MSHPKVSVVMPVYNGEAFIGEAIQSILHQTFKDIELIIIDDGSKDRTTEVVRTYHDPRIRLLINEENSGLASVRNRGLNESRGEYIAWLDCDDINLPYRLEKQLGLLETNPEIGLCGSWSRIFGNGHASELRFPADPEYLHCSMLFYNPFATSSVMIRKSILETQQLSFDPLFPPAEDYDLWERVSQFTRMANLSEVLLLYRRHENQISTILSEKQKSSIWNIQERILHRLNIHPTEEEKQIHLEIGVNWIYTGTMEALSATHSWLHKLTEGNRMTGVFPEPAFSEVLAERWKYSCFLASKNGLVAWKTFHSSPLSHFARLRLKTSLHFFVYSWLKKPWG